MALAIATGCGDTDNGVGADTADAPDTADTSDVAQADTADGGDDVREDVLADIDEDISQQERERQAVLAVPESARFELPGLTGEVHVLRTAGNIPHIYAKNRNDLMRVVGYIQASDRFFFMDTQRRLGLGSLSELLGDVALERDIESRGTAMTAIVDRLEAHMSDWFRDYMQAFADGVNVYIDDVREGRATAPAETQFSGLLGYSRPADMMSPFGVRDVLALVAVVMHSTNFETTDVGRDAAYLRKDTLFQGAFKETLRREGFFADIWDDVRPFYPGTNSAEGFGLTGAGMAVPRAGRLPGQEQGAERGARGDLPVEMVERLQAKLAQREKNVGKDREAGFGSNMWAVAGSHTADGAAILANDGHLELSVPPLAYAAGLDTALFADGDPMAPMRQMGGWLGNFPVMIGGTNGRVAFGGVNPVLDITDWYREEIRLGDDGLPAESFFQGEWRPLETFEEVYEVAAVSMLGSVGRTERIPRWTTFDGRWLTSIEGRRVGSLDELAEGEVAVNMLGDLIVPGDTDGDGVITAISFDYVGLDATRWPEALFELGMADNVEEARQATRGFVGSALFMAVVDDSGNIMFTSYQAVPCREYLPRVDGVFEEGADPTRLLDGTRFGGFEIVSEADGKADEQAGDSDPYRCVIPLDVMPHAINPDSGYIFNANSDPAGLTDDGDERNDLFHIGGPWSSMRANTIARDLDRVTANGDATAADLERMQANIESRLGEYFAPLLLAAIDEAAALAATDGPLEGTPTRMAALNQSHAQTFEAVRTRIVGWASRGFIAESGVETFYHSPSPEQRQDAIATMIFNAWFPRFMQSVWDDENIHSWRWGGGEGRVTALRRLLDGRGPGNPLGLASWDADTEEAVFFDRLGTEEVESSDELMLTSLLAGLDFLEAPPVDVPSGHGGFGTDDMEQWVWGLRHVARFDSILGPFLADQPGLSLIADLFAITTERLPLIRPMPAGDPRRLLKYFPRGGDQWAVDAGNPGLSGTRFSFGAGACMRIVIALKDGQVEGSFILPGGQSGIPDSPHFDDQVQLWLGNEAYAIRFAVEDVVAGATGREVYAPPEPE